MPKFHVEKSITINAPISQVIDILTNFDEWIPWSPWLLMEPDAKIDVSEDKRFYSWDGSRVGAGNMTFLEMSSHNNITTLLFDLNFLKPWKSQANVAFVLQDKGTITEATWSMDSALPFYLFWMKKMMIAFIGMDYQRGLNMLQEYAEHGKIYSKIHHVGKKTVDAVTFIGIKQTCHIDDIGPSMESAFDQLQEFHAKHLQECSGAPFSIYHKWNIAKAQAEYTAALPLLDAIKELESNMYIETMPKHDIYTIEHHGDYRHLGNAWTTLYTMERNKELKCAKGIHPYEVYVNSPLDTKIEDLRTHVCFPVV